MSDHILHELQQSAELALSAKTVQEGVSHLSRAFALFSKETSRLKNAHLKLQEHFQTVNQDLATKTSEINRLNIYLNTILKKVGDAILFVDLEGSIKIANESLLKLLNLNDQEVLNQRFWNVFSDGRFGFSMREALKFGISHRQIYRDEMEISTSFIYDGPKSDHGMLLHIKDLKEKERLQQIANRNDRMIELGKVAATVAHEIRNPLGGIRGYASLLYRDLEGSGSLQEMAEYIIEGTKALEKIVSAVLTYSKPIELEPVTQDLGTFLKKLGKFIKVDPAFPPNISLKMHIPNDPILAPIDPQALRSAMLNLIFNAFQAMPDGGELTITLLKVEPHAQISIADTGIGMSEEQLDLLFSPFYTTKKGGHGLGLVETEKIVQGHHGKLETRSKPGKGTTFTMNLPLKR